MKGILFKTSISLQPFISNIKILHILCLVILIKVDTSQVPQRNCYMDVNSEASDNIMCHSKDSSVPSITICQ